MKLFKIKNIVSVLAASGLLVAGIISYAERHEVINLFQPPVNAPADTSQTEQRYKPSRRPTYKPKDRVGDPFTNRDSRSPMELKTPENIKINTELDSTQESFEISEKAGDLDYRPPTDLNFKDYAEWRNDQMSKSYWRDKSDATSGGANSPISAKPKGLNPRIQMPPVFDRIFGGNYIDIKPNGMVLLDFGGQYQKTNNPAIPIRQQRSGGFRFDQQISFNMVGKVGERLTIRANWDTKATFDFDNNIKIEYKALEQDIIKRIELGNVSMPTNSALITGAQNLFGVKAQLQFGRLYMTTVVANQRSKVDEIVIPGGSAGPGKEYEIKAFQYDELRHFWLGHFFRNNYDKWLQSSPFVTSGVQINRVEIYITNRTNTTQNLRSVTAFMDLGEPRPYNRTIQQATFGNSPADALALRDSVNTNNANGLYRNIFNQPDNRSGQSAMTGNAFGMQSGIDYEIIKSAKQLVEGVDFRINRQLGYISLNTQLRTDEALAVAYEYSYKGQTYKVGELNEDYNNLEGNQNAYFKMLRPANINVRIPTFDLMMKNIYQLPSTNINRNGFQLRVIYKDDSTGIDNPFLQQGTAIPVEVNGRSTGLPLKEFPLVQLFNVDNLNPNGDPGPDGNWDYIGGVSVDSINGRVIFGVKEPFGNYLLSKFDTNSEALLVDKYVFTELYRQTRNNAEQLSAKNKFFLKGRFQSGSSQDIQLQGLNIAQGSIRVLSGSTTLVEGSDYTVNYELGRVRIVNPGILTSGNDITIRFEKADLFNFRQKTLYGTRLDYRVHRDFNIGGTFMHLRERPLITRVSFGDDPLFNTMWGLDVNYAKESRFLTKMIDALPLVQTKEPSHITVKAEVAQLIPGTPPQIGKDNANMYIDDFEGTETPYDLTRQPIRWVLGSTPINFYDPASLQSDPLSYSYRRAKLAWYNVDQTAFYQTGPQRPPKITEEQLKNHYVRSIPPREIYPQKSLLPGYANELTLDLAYYPNERGMYNFNPNLNPNGTLPDPKNNYASLTRAITFDTDFDNANIQYIEFWMMNPFISGTNGNLLLDGRPPIDNSTNPGGELWFHLGSVSEDVMKDGEHFFENGLPPEGGVEGTEQTPWGKVSTATYLNNAFSNLGNARDNQDVGLDGLKTSEEQERYRNYVNEVNSRVTDPVVKERILADISNDNFQYFLTGDSPNILERYKNYNGTENNSSVNTDGGFVQSNTNNPDNEDLNQNNTVSDLEQYFEYKVDIRKSANGGLDERTNGFVVGQITTPVNGDDVTWYQIRIPIRTRPKAVNGITDFKSIRFIRMVMTGWEQPVVLRMSQFQMVGSLWRPLDTLSSDKGSIRVPEPRNRGKVQISTVNIEENSNPGPGTTPYVVPPEFVRDRDNTSALNRLQNEQSLRICVDNLEAGDVAPAYKLINLNFINSTRIKMFLHAESSTASDKELEGFVRIGTDFDQNYYDIRVPLKLTPPGSSEATVIWPVENDVDVPLEHLSFVKTQRNKAGFPQNRIFSLMMDGKIISVRGNPDFTSTQIVMIGIQNPITNTRGHQICIWANELRTSGVNKSPGWAAVGSLNAKLADLANLTATGSYKSSGFGAIDQKITARQRNNTYQYGAASNISMDKFIPGNTGIKVPVYVSYDKKIIKPEYDPLNPDTRLSTSLAALQEDQREERADMVIDRSTRRSISLNNLQKVKTSQNKKSHLWDVENLVFTMGYSDIFSSNYLTQRYFFKNYKAGIGYTYGGNPKAFEPLKGIKGKSKYLQLFTAFNVTPLPSNLSFRTDLDRRFAVTQLRGSDLTTNGVLPLYEKSFYLNRSYGLRWAFTKSLGMDYRSNVSTIIDEPTGEINDDRVDPRNPNSITKRDSVLNNFQKLGRVKNFDQNFNFTYRTPLDKLPITDWTQADLNYSANYMWKAGALGFVDSLGNQVQNNRIFSINGKMDLLKLYNKLKFLREVNAPLTQIEQQHDQKREQWKRQLDNPNLNKSQKDSLQNLINKKYLSEMRPVRGAFQALMLLKNLNLTYERSEGTMLPGFNKTPKFFGLDESDMAPGIPFILGDQSDRIRQEARERDWIAQSRFQSSPFVKTRATKLTYRTSLEPIKQFRIQLEGRQEQTHTYNEFFRFNDNRQLVSESPTRTGSFRTSIITALTSLAKDNPNDNKNEVFEKFVDNRNVIQSRLNANRPNGIGRYDTSSQEVIIPAFLAAYTGRDPNKVALSAFPRIPLPNWRIDYGGLSTLGFIKKYFSSVNLNHSYTSLYNVSNYTSSLQYGNEKINSQGSVFDMPVGLDTNGRAVYIPTYVIGQVSIQESFSPLIGINMKTKKNITVNVRYNLNRNLNLSTTNSQVMEMKSQDWSFSVGYTKTGMKLPIKYKQRVIVLKNEATFRFDFTVRDSRTVQRRPYDLNVITQGLQQIQIKPTINYRVNDRLSVQIYYDQSITIPRVSSSFRRTNTLFGVQVRFSLS